MAPWLLAQLLVLAGCGAADIDTGGDDLPDIRGRYNVELRGATGCDGNQDLLDSWAPGALDVTGPATDLDFDFGDGAVLEGFVDATYSFQASGLVQVDEWEVSVLGLGVVFREGGMWVLEGDLDGVADDNGIEADDCTITGPFTAQQVSR